MVRNMLTLRPQLHLPLRRVALCLDCEECFELGSSVCPACGSETWTPLARFLDAGAPSLECSARFAPEAA